MKLSEFRNKYKNSIFNIAVIILAMVIANNIYKKQNNQIASLRSKIDMQIKMNGELEEIGRLEQKIDAYKNFLTYKDINSTINTITNIAKESGLSISSIRPIQQKSYADYIKLPFDLTVSIPSYHALGKFISKLESYADPYQVEFLSIRSEKTAERLNVNLRISTSEIIK